MNITTYAEKGRRSYQEDRNRVFYDKDTLIIGVFDGHGGEYTSDYCEQHMYDVWNSATGSTLKMRLRQTIKKFNADTKDHHTGSTASLVALDMKKNIAHCCVIGDSPIITKDKYGKIRISPEHNVRSNPKEIELAQARGGTILYGYLYDASLYDGAGLQMSRALGDKSLSNVLSRIPQLYTVELGKGSWVLVASDGLLDPGHQNRETATLTKMIEDGHDAKDLVKYAVELPTHDNVTAVLVKL